MENEIQTNEGCGKDFAYRIHRNSYNRRCGGVFRFGSKKLMLCDNCKKELEDE